MSTHVCPVVKIAMQPHPNADALSVMEVMGWEVCLRTAEWTDGQLAVYVPPDYCVPDTEIFAWLKSDSKNWNRVRTRKFRQRYSHGIMIPAPQGLREGDNAMETLGITRYEPPMPISAGGDNETGPQGFYPKYDVENYQRYKSAFNIGEEVIATEKIHGANARFVFTWEDKDCFDTYPNGKSKGIHVLEEGRMWAGSRTNWKAKDDKNLWWQALAQNPWIEKWCKRNPGLVVYGEVFGQVQNLKYGTKPGQVCFRAFDILHHDHWMDYDEARNKARMLSGWNSDLLWVPEVYRGPFDEDILMQLALEDSSFGDAEHMREGLVIRPAKERHDPALGRVQLKMVSPRYLEKN